MLNGTLVILILSIGQAFAGSSRRGERCCSSRTSVIGRLIGFSHYNALRVEKLKLTLASLQRFHSVHAVMRNRCVPLYDELDPQSPRSRPHSLLHFAMASHSLRTSLSPVNSGGSLNSGTVSPTRKRKRKGTTEPTTTNNPHDAGYVMYSATSKRFKAYQLPSELPPPMPIGSEEQLIQPSSSGDGSMWGSSTSSTESMASRRLQKAPVKDSFGSPGSATSDSPDKHELHTAQDALLQAQAQIAELERVLADQQERFDHDKKALTQDMVLGHVMMQEALTKRVVAAQRHRHSVQRLYNEQKKATEELQCKLDTLTEKYQRSSLDIKAAEDGRAHLETVLRTLTCDLDELRQFENEESARRRKEKQGLPPAYKDYRKRKHQAPYERHKDAGAFDTAELEEIIRADFDTALCQADKKRLQIVKDDSGNRTKADALIFCQTSHSLRKSCRLLKNVLTSNPEEADWIADFIVELLWDVVSACEVRPVTIHLTAADKSKLALGFQEVDEILLEALKKGHELDDGEDELPLYELQRYLTQVNCIHRVLINLTTQAGYDYFGHTITWLEEQVELERVRVANAP